MLMSLDIPLPRQVFAHGFMTLKGERLSEEFRKFGDAG